MKMNLLLIFIGIFCLSNIGKESDSDHQGLKLIVLGNVQDAGSPHAGCKNVCCKNLFMHPDPDRKVVSLGILDGLSEKKYLIEATPDLPQQMKRLFYESGSKGSEVPDAIFLTHAHIGHYSGLMYLGRESMNSKNVPVYVMPLMKSFLENNGPWSQLVNLENITLNELKEGMKLTLSDHLAITPLKVPHRDEYSETVGFLIEGEHKKALFIPDIDKWEKWKQNIQVLIKEVDYAFLDATFFDENELPNRKMSEVPHPFVEESMTLFDSLPALERNKIWFIHLNHTNPLLHPNSKASKSVLEKGYHIARLGDEFDM